MVLTSRRPQLTLIKAPVITSEITSVKRIALRQRRRCQRGATRVKQTCILVKYKRCQGKTRSKTNKHCVSNSFTSRAAEGERSQGRGAVSNGTFTTQGLCKQTQGRMNGQTG